MINLDTEKINSFCEKWKISELSLFGSSTTENFQESSDVDVLVSFEDVAKWTLFDHVDMKNQLEEIFNRKVDFVTKKGLINSSNEIRKKSILDNSKRVYFRA